MVAVGEQHHHAVDHRYPIRTGGRRQAVLSSAAVTRSLQGHRTSLHRRVARRFGVDLIPETLRA